MNEEGTRRECHDLDLTYVDPMPGHQWVTLTNSQSCSIVEYMFTNLYGATLLAEGDGRWEKALPETRHS